MTQNIFEEMMTHLSDSEGVIRFDNNGELNQFREYFKVFSVYHVTNRIDTHPLPIKSFPVFLGIQYNGLVFKYAFALSPLEYRRYFDLTHIAIKGWNDLRRETKLPKLNTVPKITTKTKKGGEFSNFDWGTFKKKGGVGILCTTPQEVDDFLEEAVLTNTCADDEVEVFKTQAAFFGDDAVFAVSKFLPHASGWSLSVTSANALKKLHYKIKRWSKYTTLPKLINEDSIEDNDDTENKITNVEEISVFDIGDEASEKNNYFFDWDDFISDKIAVACVSHDEIVDFVTRAANHNCCRYPEAFTNIPVTENNSIIFYCAHNSVIGNILQFAREDYAPEIERRIVSWQDYWQNPNKKERLTNLSNIQVQGPPSYVVGSRPDTFENTLFSRDELKTGHIVRFANNTKGFVVKGLSCNDKVSDVIFLQPTSKKRPYIVFSEFTKTLLSTTERAFDIVEVYIAKDKSAFGAPLFSNKEESIWKRKRQFKDVKLNTTLGKTDVWYNGIRYHIVAFVDGYGLLIDPNNKTKCLSLPYGTVVKKEIK